MASEAWALVALFPEAEAVVPCEPPPDDAICIECRTDVKSLLRKLGKGLRPKLVVSQEGRLKNQASGYQEQQGEISRSWATVVAHCRQAARFDAELRAIIHSSP